MLITPRCSDRGLQAKADQFPDTATFFLCADGGRGSASRTIPHAARTGWQGPLPLPVAIAYQARNRRAFIDITAPRPLNAPGNPNLADPGALGLAQAS